MENSQKMVIFKLVCCHGNILQHTHVNEKEIPGMWLIFTVNATSLNPKVETNSSFLVFQPSSGVHTVKAVGSHLNNMRESRRNARVSRNQGKITPSRASA